MKKNMTKQTKRWFCIVAVLLAVIIALGITLGVATKWGKDLDNLKPGNDTANQTGGGMEPDESGESHGIALSFTEIAREQFGDYGISPASETAQSVTAKITPEYAVNSTLKWTLSWENGTSGKFGYQKDVSDYVTGSASQDTHTYNLQCSQAFGEVIILKVTAEADGNVFATRKIQYRQGGFSGLAVMFSGATAGGWMNGFTPATTSPKVDFPVENEEYLEDSITIRVNPGMRDAVYTLPAEITDIKVEVKCDSDYFSLVQICGSKGGKADTYVTLGNSSSFSTTWKDILMLDFDSVGGSFNFSGYMTTLWQHAQAGADSCRIFMKVSAMINGSEESAEYNIQFNSDGFGNLAPTSIGWSDDGSDIVFGG